MHNVVTLKLESLILKTPRDKLGLALESNANVSDFPFFHFFSKWGVRGRSKIMFAQSGGGRMGRSIRGNIVLSI